MQPSSRIAGIDGLRALAASAILLVHVWLATGASSPVLSLLVQPLNAGVTLFFALSGFLLWRPFAAAVIRMRDAPSLGRYARQRALRILPAYWAVLLVAALVLSSARLTPVAPEAANGSITDPGLLLKDLLLVQNLAPSTISSGLVPAWSLSVEVAFIALLPLLGMLALRLGAGAPQRRRRLVAALSPAGLMLGVGIAGALATAFLLPGPARVFGGDWHSVLSWSLLNHAGLFAFGMAVAELRVEHEDGRLALPAWLRPAVDRVLLYALVPFLVIGYFALPPALYDPAMAALWALLLARVVLPLPHARPSRLVRVLECRALVVIGLASYSIFLWNFPITIFLADNGLLVHTHAAWGFALNAGIVGGIVAVLSAITYLAIERPCMRLATPRRSPVARRWAVPSWRPAREPMRQPSTGHFEPRAAPRRTARRAADRRRRAAARTG